jgi:hypothetical protein
MTRHAGTGAKAGLLLVLCLLGVAADEASAVIGRPLTPVSYAGVARRTARRTTYAAAATAPYAASTAYVTTLPPNCGTTVVNGMAYRSCAGRVYRPYYSGATVVYYPQ